MARMTDSDIDEFLSGTDHKNTMILAVARDGRGPLCVPLSFRWTDSTIRFSTKRSRLHTRAFLRTGRATAMIHHEQYDPGVQVERYVALEGPIAVPAGAEGDPDTFVEAVIEPESTVGMVYDFYT